MSRSRRTDRYGGPRGGLAAVEFALVAPFIIMVMLAGTDLTIFMRTMMRVDETASETSLAVTQYQKSVRQRPHVPVQRSADCGRDDPGHRFDRCYNNHRHSQQWRQTDNCLAAAQPVGHVLQPVRHSHRQRSESTEQLSVAIRRNTDRSGSLHYGNSLDPQRQPAEWVRRDIDSFVCALPTPSGITISNHSGKSPMTRRGLLQAWLGGHRPDCSRYHRLP